MKHKEYKQITREGFSRIGLIKTKGIVYFVTNYPEDFQMIIENAYFRRTYLSKYIQIENNFDHIHIVDEMLKPIGCIKRKCKEVKLHKKELKMINVQNKINVI